MPTTIHYDLLDAFNSRPFSGNPAAVVTLDKDTKAKFDREDLYQTIAAEINMPATGFVTPLEDGRYDICWWHPGGEINLCGHASLATSKALFNRLNAKNGGEEDEKKAVSGVKTIEYISKAGPLKATLLDDGRVELGFPAAGLVPFADSCDAEQVEDIKAILKDAVQDDGVEILDLQRGVGDAFDNWLIVKVECSKKALKDLSVKLDTIVSRLISFSTFTISRSYLTLGFRENSLNTTSPKSASRLKARFLPPKPQARPPISTSSAACSRPLLDTTKIMLRARCIVFWLRFGRVLFVRLKVWTRRRSWLSRLVRQALGKGGWR
jgi:PhzF family phenazine biosynthesis protein